MPLSMLEMSPVELVVVEGISPANEACRVTPRDGASGSTPVKMTTKDETVFRLSTCRGLAFFRLSPGRLERALLAQIYAALTVRLHISTGWLGEVSVA